MAIYLKQIVLSLADIRLNEHPYDVPALQQGCNIIIDSPILILAGENGAGKSTLLSAIAQSSGFNPAGGNQHHIFGDEAPNPLAEHITLSWAKKIHQGFYLRGDRQADFQRYLTDVSKVDPSVFASYGGKNLGARSHGESIFSLYQYHFRNGIFFLDEPETALSFTRQLSLISILKTLTNDQSAQFIIATHSPALMSMPDSQLIFLDETGLHPSNYTETETYKTSRLFFDSPERFHKHL